LTFGGPPLSTNQDIRALLAYFYYQFSYTPTLASTWLNLVHRVLTLPILSAREKGLAVFAVLSHSRAAYALYAHTRLADTAGLSPGQVADARGGKLPQGLSERKEVAYVFAGELVRMRGPVDHDGYCRTF